MKTLFLTLYLFCALPLFCEGYTVVEDRANLTIETPALAKRQVRKLRLENGLEALLISDPDTPQSGAAMAVNVGSWEDPEGRPGMAHFVEHLLFLGTEKYPDEEAYSRYLDEHGGTRNAFTMADRTVYMFSVNNHAFSGALDRFGHFFISPLFNPSGVDRESKAIHQEYCRNVPLDPWRMLHVKKELSNPSHPFHAFNIGNKETLKKISQEELKAWYATHYSANLMHLVVVSPLDLDTLETEVVSLFSQVKNREKNPFRCTEPLCHSKQMSQLVAIAPVQDLQLLELSWELPRFYGQDTEYHADKLVAHVLGHEGETSLLAQLKRENLAETLSAGTFRAGHDQVMFTLTVHLTAEGIASYERVVERCFEGIAAIQKNGIPRYLFDEIVLVEEQNYRFQSRDDLFKQVTDLAMRMIDEPLETFPRHSLLPSSYSQEKIDALLSVLTPRNCQYTLVANPVLSKKAPTKREPWLGVPYTTLAFPKEKVEAWSQCRPHQAICVPRPNPFIPENLKTAAKNISDPLFPKPICLAENDKGCIYTCQDQQYFVPEISWTFLIKTPAISDRDPTSHALADLYCYAVDEQLNALAYEASVAGLDYTLKPKHGALELTLLGYQPKVELFLKTLLKTLATIQISQKEFTLYRDLLTREYLNGANASPIKQGGELLWSILYKDHSGLDAKAAAIQKISYKQMKAFCQNVLAERYVEGMLYGSQTESQAKQIVELIDTELRGRGYPPERHEKIELATLPSNDHPAYLLRESTHPANALILTIDCGSFTFKKRAAQEILTKGLEEPFFSELRTRQQTAYLVTNWSQEIERHLYSFFAIQSSSHDTRDLLARFELFVESSLQHLSESVIPEERFEAIRAALVHKLENPAENLQRMGGLLQTLAADYDGDFDWFDKRIAAVKELSYQEFIAYAQEFLGGANPRRMAICVDGELPHQGRVSYREVTAPEKIRQEISYHSRT